jgi:hypothetical protein
VIKVVRKEMEPLNTPNTRKKKRAPADTRVSGLRLRPAGFRFSCLALHFASLACATGISAHQLDEYLQATLVEIEPGSIRLQMNLTPGVAVAERIVSLVDRDANGVISTNEATAYVELLKRDLSLRLDGRELDLHSTQSYFPEIEELRTGWAFVQVEYCAKTGALKPGEHKLAIRNQHLARFSAYLLNASQPKSAAVQVIKQVRTENQSGGDIEFKVHGAPSSAGPGAALPSIALLVIAVGVLWAVRKTGGGVPQEGRNSWRWSWEVR